MENIPMSERERKNAETAYLTAAAGMVLLENTGALPLKKKGKIALFGVGAVRTVRGGTGSGDPFNGGLSGGGNVLVDQSPRYHIHILDAFEAGGYEVVTAADLRILAEQYDSRKIKQENQVMHTFVFPEPFLTDDEVKAAAHQSDTAIFVISRNSGEGSDRQMLSQAKDFPGAAEIGDYLLSAQEKDNLRLVRTYFKELIVILNVGGIIDLSEVKMIQPDSILLMGLAGQEGGRAVRDVLNATLVPSGKLTDTWAARYADYPAAATFANNDGNVEQEMYQEGIFVGYRYFDSFDMKPLYEFGFGKSYTDFTVSIKTLQEKDHFLRVEGEITNIGNYPGAEVLQLYVTAANTGADMPWQELKAFAKTAILEPGETQTVVLETEIRELAIYEEASSAYVVKKGIYLFHAGTSSRMTKPVGKVLIEADILTDKAAMILPLPGGLEELQHRNDADEEDFYPGLPEIRLSHQEMKLSVQEREAAIRNQTVITYTTDSAYRSIQPYEKVALVPARQVMWADVLAGRVTYETLVAQMTDEELAALNCGTGWGVADENNPVIGENSESVPGAAGETTHILEEKYGIPSIVLVDGPGGIRIRQEYEALNLQTGQKEQRHRYCTAWPSGTLLAQSFDSGIMAAVGRAMAVEMKEIGAHILLAPGMNIHRDPLCGRNFEYYSEDPYVSGIMAAAFVSGMQESGLGVGACIKHYAANNQETNRSAVDEWIGQRALREIYLKGFEIAVRKSQPFAIMTSYNLINQVPTADSYDLCTALARGEWDFQGLIMTDWNGGSSSASKSMHAGNDLIMPGGKSKIREILLALKQMEPVFDEKGQILFTKVFEQLPFYEEYWNSFQLKADGQERCTAVVGDGHQATMEGDKIMVDHEPVYTAVTGRHEFIRSAGKAEPFQTPLTNQMAELGKDGREIIYYGEYDRHQTICRGDLQKCAVHILTVLRRVKEECL